MNEKQLERIREDIKVYRARLASEKRRFGGYFDKGGIRYLIPELYIKIKDYKGALSYFRWFSREFPDDIGSPFFFLIWTFTLFQNKKYTEAIRLAYKTAFSNTYVLDLISNKEVANIDKSEMDDSQNIDHAIEIIEWFNNHLTKEFKSWIGELTETEDYKINMNRFISIQKLIKDEPVGPLRSHLLQESYKLEKELTRRNDD